MVRGFRGPLQAILEGHHIRIGVVNLYYRGLFPEAAAEKAVHDSDLGQKSPMVKARVTVNRRGHRLTLMIFCKVNALTIKRAPEGAREVYFRLERYAPT